MTNTPTEERQIVAEDAAPDAAAAPTPAVVTEPIPFWQRRYVDRFVFPLFVPIAVVLFIITYVLNISRLFLAGHGHISVIVGSAITVMILVGATLLAAGTQKLRSPAMTLVTAAFILSIMSGGWLVLGHAQPEKTGPTSLPSTLKVSQTLAVTAAPGGNLKFDPATLTATTGLAKINVTVAASGHTFNLREPTTLWTSLSLDATGAVKSGVAFFPTAGTYGYFCAIPGHDAAGMHGTITVTGPPMTLTQALVAAKNAPTAAG